ncbi:MAG TPA: DNA gyrase subunit B, partial [Gammaproteobacteria bacterium]|nr:DNA gyrase subunit B [Gammaproteobacteria bacterium]
GRDRRFQAILPLKGKILNVEKARFDKMLASVEVGTLITALGCGIGREEFNPDKIRYYRIIIMTDADVDGSHIRTLLLTFFYRQMAELIERGHIYIAQPPLYKVKKGKQEQYVKDDVELSAHLLQMALEGARLVTKGNETVPLTGQALEELARGYMTVMAMIQRLSRRYDATLLEQLIYQPPLNESRLRDESYLKEWVARLVERLNDAQSERSYEAIVEPCEDDEGYSIIILRRAHSLIRQARLTAEFFASPEYAVLIQFGGKLSGLFEQQDTEVRRGERVQPVSNFRAVMDWLLEEAKRGQHIQRYKGLGEMNPDQLWETTMNPETRRLLQVRIEDAVAADEVFTTLMGDQVEPRRDFIEQNALDVLNLDV